jgi:hypothetical protein
MRPICAFVGVSQDKRTVWLAQLFRIPLTWCHIFWLFEFADGSLLVHEANWRGVRRAEWDDAHRADAWALFTDDRMDTEAVGRLWSFCLGAEGKFYDYRRLVGLALRLAFEAWARLTGRVTVLARVSEVCSSYVNEAARAVFGEPYVDRETPSPDEIVGSEHLVMVGVN